MKFKINAITTEDNKRVIYIKYDGELTEDSFSDTIQRDMINQIADEIFNTNELMKKFFTADKTFGYLEILEQVGELEEDNEYIDLSKHEYFDTDDFIDTDIDELIKLVHKEFIIYCLEFDYYDICGNIDEEEKIITYYI